MDFLSHGIIQAFQLIVHGDPETFSAILSTLQVTAYTMVASLSIGIPAGFLLGYYQFRGKRQLRTVLDTLLSLPTVFIGLMVYAFLSHRGPLGQWGLLFTLQGIAIGQTILALKGEQ